MAYDVFWPVSGISVLVLAAVSFRWSHRVVHIVFASFGSAFAVASSESLRGGSSGVVWICIVVEALAAVMALAARWRDSRCSGDHSAKRKS